MEKKCGRNSVGKRVAYPRRVILGHNKKSPTSRFFGGIRIMRALSWREKIFADRWNGALVSHNADIPLSPASSNFPLKQDGGTFFEKKYTSARDWPNRPGWLAGKRKKTREKEKMREKKHSFPLILFSPRKTCVRIFLHDLRKIPPLFFFGRLRKHSPFFLPACIAVRGGGGAIYFKPFHRFFPGKKYFSKARKLRPRLRYMVGNGLTRDWDGVSKRQLNGDERFESP